MSESVPIWIRVRDLSFAFERGHPLFTKLNLDVHANELVWIMGPNGAGKSTLLRILLGSESRYRGGAVQNRLNRDEVAYLPQIHHSHFHIPMRLRDVAGPGPLYGLLTSRQLELDWNSSSGGEKRRALILRVIRRNPKLLIFDEPFNHVDQESVQKIWGFLKKRVMEGQGSVLLISHAKEPEIAEENWSRVLVLREGRLHES